MKYLAHMHTDKCAWLNAAIYSGKDNAGLLQYANLALADRYVEFHGIITDYKSRPAASRVSLIGPVLKEFYGSPPKSLREKLHNRRRKHELDECPYCGHPLPPRTLDHFLPKDDWPEFAIFSNNLVPQCVDCAPIKGSRYYCDSHNQALFLHPMYSSALSTVRFCIDVTLEKGQPKFVPKFNILDEVSIEDEWRIKLHIESLGVKQRINDYCQDQYRRWIRIVSRKGADIQASFKIRLKERQLDQYASNWSIAFYQGVLRSPEAVADLQRHAPHGPPRPHIKFRALLIDD